MFKVKLGQPRNKQLLRMMEDPDKRRAIDKAELSFYADTKKEELFALKEELFFTIDEKSNEADTSEEGRVFLNPDDPNAFVLPDLINEFTEIDLDETLSPEEKDKRKAERQQHCDAQAERIHNISQLLRAYCLFEKDVQYVIEDNKVVIVDEFTGRKMPGRRWSDGLHQAVEAKEGVEVQEENQTIATISYQNYFRLYKKLAGMTGTADTEAEEFHKIYKLDVSVVPTNRPIRRDDADPENAGNPGHELLPEKEQDFQLALARFKAQCDPEKQEVIASGGLHILGTERHESRRIDNQLRGRAGRQGDPGSSRFFLSLEDDLMRIFAGDKVKALMQRLGMEKGVAIESKMVSKRIAAAQKSVDVRNFETRKHLLEYDDVMNKHRETIYGLRRQLMEEHAQREYLVGETGVPPHLLADLTKQYLNPNAAPDNWDVENYKVKIQSIYGLAPDAEGIDFGHANPEEIEDQIWEQLKAKYADKEKQIGDEAMRTYERIIMLNIIDAQWKDHLLALDHLKQGIGLVGYGQKDPLVEYKKESFDMFQAMLDRIDTTTIRSLFNLQVVAEESPEALRQKRGPRRPLTFTGPNQGAAPAGEEAGKTKTIVRSEPKVGRNDPCPCGSGKKYKKCHSAA